MGRVERMLLLVGLLIVAMVLRTSGLDWDEGTHLHPDERFLTMVVGNIKSPGSLTLYLDTDNSPLNPYNQGYGNFFYGTLPVFLVRYAGEWADVACAEDPFYTKGSEAAPSPLARAVVRLLFAPPTFGEGKANDGVCSPGTFTGYGGVYLVGRVLSTMADLGTLIVLFFIGRRLYGPGVGLLAVALGALAVLPIQQSHFFTVDTFAQFFVVVTLYFAVLASQTGGWAAFGLAGLASGLAVTCKMSTWPAALVVALAGLAYRSNGRSTRRSAVGRQWSVLLRLSVAAILFLLAFRLAQPYAFQGPGLFGVRLNQQWLSDMGFIRRLMSGEVDSPPGHQWTDRTPIVFPWINMVVWGMGIPLGLAAWGGWALTGVELLRGRREHLIPWAWGTGFFLYQATQWVKSMRYLLPVYGVFTLFAAYALWRLIHWARTRPKSIGHWSLDIGHWTVVIGYLPVAVVLGGTLLWALAFTSIYTRTTTRILASRWIYRHVPAGATLHYETSSGPATLQIPVPAGHLYTGEGELQTPFTMPEDGVATAITFNYLGDPERDPEMERFRVALADNPNAHEVLVESMGEWALPPLAAGADGFGLEEGPEAADTRGAACAFALEPVPLQGGRTYKLISECTHGGPVQSGTSVVANEHWDDGLPMRIDGHNPFGGMYQGLSTSSDGQMQNYNEDTLEKRAKLFAWLDETDYIFLSSNRLYGSIARLPARYPLTTAYYRALFAGELGFELAADITSYPALGPFQFPDQECPYSLMEASYANQRKPIVAPLPSAEEAFSVYDHPRVLIFRKTADYSSERVRTLLGGIDVEHALHGRKPIDATATPDLLEYDPQTWAEQQAGGTWSEMFDRGGLLNRYPGLAAVAWWVVVTGLGGLAFPLVFVALSSKEGSHLRDRGYGLARVLGLLLVAYLTWLAASLRILPNTRGTILRMCAFLALLGGGVGWFRRRELRQFVHDHWRLILLTEGLFALLYLFWIGVRLLHPDLWHPIVGGEKPMDFAYLNAVMKSTWFPPYNPWFSGSYINYYYFGFVIVGTLIKLMGTVPAIAYNLAVPLLYALTGVTAFSVGYNLFGGRRRGARLAGVMALVFTVALGNLGVVRLIRAALIKLGGEPFPSTIPVFAETVSMVRGLWQVVAHGVALPLRPESWYWDPTRIIPTWPGEVGPITEFPAFTFLYGDLHAHMIALPLTLVAIALAVHWARSQRPRWLSLAIGGLVIGALRPTNTWDYPTFLLLGIAALALGAWRRDNWTRGQGDKDTNLPPPIVTFLRAFAWRAALLVVLATLLYLPYIQHYAAGYTSVEMWHGSRTPARIFVWIHGIQLFPLVTWLLIEVLRLRTANRRLQSAERASVRKWRLALALGVSGLLCLTVALVALGYPVALVVVPVGAGAACLVLVPSMPSGRRLVWLMVLGSMGLCLAVEIIVLTGDIGRMNTVFKFYLQVWTLLSVAAAVTLAWVRERARRWQPEWRQLWWLAMGILIFGGALFLPYGIRARAIDRMAPQADATLDGMAFVEHAVVSDGAPERGSQEIPLSGDYAAIRWMQDNVQGSPVIMEGLGHREYLWSNRVSVYTGLPAVIGWRWHQVQQRALLPAEMVDWRRIDVSECYNTTDVARAREILARYGVGYVYVGAYERAYYNPAGLSKFEAMAAQGLLRVVYDAQGVKIYEVVG